MPSARATCRDCLFFDGPIPDAIPERGICRRHAPRGTVPDVWLRRERLPDRYAWVIWPRVGADEWCGALINKTLAGTTGNRS